MNLWLRRLALVVTFAALAYLTWRAVLSPPEYHVDTDVYRKGARAWLDGRPLYGDAVFATQTTDGPLPFTYPPLAAIVFTPLALVSLPTATAALTVTTMALLVVCLAITLSGRWALCAGFAAVALWLKFEPLWATLAYGQINVVLMTLVLADCVPRRTWWPRGMAVGLAMAVKLTPAVFLLYFVLRRQYRAAATALITFLTATGVAAILAPADSWEYWTKTVLHTGRIGYIALSTNQNITGALARLAVPSTTATVIWVVASVTMLALSVWAARRALDASEPVLALMCIALFALVVSPVSWSHHWVWLLPAVASAGAVGCRRRNVPLMAVALIGLLMVASPAVLALFHERSEALFSYLGLPYVFFAIAYCFAVRSTRVPDKLAGS
jgi:alpha-1,2-mannosyltransferase